MNISILIIEFRLPGCLSLKEKRSRMSALKYKYGKIPHIAIIESGFQNDYQFAEWTLIITANNSKIIDSTISEIELNIETIVDANISQFNREKLY